MSRSGGAENFEREAETWVNLGLHPHAVSCYYVRRLGGVPRVFAEFIEGGSLSDWIKDGRLYEGAPEAALARILDIAIQFAWGLDYSHEQGLIHQDVKPANVMMTKDGLAKVTDFGLARARPMAGGDAGEGPQQTMMVASLGMTPAYASPEQATGQTLTRRTDLWSWGVSLLEMFTGEVLWPMGTTVAGFLEEYLKSGPENSKIPMMPPETAELLRLVSRKSGRTAPDHGRGGRGTDQELQPDSQKGIPPDQTPGRQGHRGQPEQPGRLPAGPGQAKGSHGGVQPGPGRGCLITSKPTSI